MAEFVQIENQAFNPEQVTVVRFVDEQKSIVLYCTGRDVLYFTGDEYDLFLKWWEHRAEVYKVV